MKTEATRTNTTTLTAERLLEIAEATSYALKRAGLITRNGSKRQARTAESIARRMIACLSLSGVSAGVPCEELPLLVAAWIEDQHTEESLPRPRETALT